MSTACAKAGGAFIAGNLAVMGGAGRRLVLRVEKFVVRLHAGQVRAHVGESVR